MKVTLGEVSATHDPVAELHQRIADALGWKISAVHSFSLQTLREMVRVKHPKLAANIADVVARGAHIYRR